MMNKTENSAPRPVNLRSLQVLRAIAATSVVYFHIAAIPYFGSYGVDIFFVISGFVMAMLVASNQPVGVFVASRLARIVPLYWLMTAGVLVLAMIRPDLFNSTTANLSNFLKSILFIPYFKENGLLQPMLAVGWTLNYEMMFYGCVAVGMLVLRQHVLVMTFGLLTLLFALANIFLEPGPARAFFGRDLVYEFILGMLAYHVHLKRWLNRLPRWALVAIALGSFSFMAWIEAAQEPWTRIWAYGLPSLALVLAVVAMEDWQAVMGGRAARFLAVVGDGSYATYLSHFYVVEGLRKVVAPKVPGFDLYSPLGVVVVIAAAWAVGHVIYVLLDKPLAAAFKRLLVPKRPVSAKGA